MAARVQKVFVRDRVWRVQDIRQAEGRQLFSLLDPDGGETLQVMSPPETVEFLPAEAPEFSAQAVSPWGAWITAHNALQQLKPGTNDAFAALHSGRISPEPYQFVPVRKLIDLPRPRLLLADDVGLGKTIEAGICMLELIARGRGKRILLVVPPGLIPQWQDEMLDKFGLYFHAIENAASLERVQTGLAEGIKPWLFLNRVITSIEYIKKKEVIYSALSREAYWDIIVVDEAHYVAESGTPRNPYSTARTRLGEQLREACQGLLLLTATPHNGYSHSFRSLVELVEPTDATFGGEKETVQRRVHRNMVRRLKPQIFKTDQNGKRVPAFPPREPVTQIPVTDLTADEKGIFKKVSAYCSKTAKAAANTDDSELISFAMQIIKKRMLSSRTALMETVSHRLDALKAKETEDEPPTRAEVRELQGDLPLGEAAHERIAERVLRASVPKDVKRRNAERKQLAEIGKLLEKVEARPDPKIAALIQDLKRDVLSVADEKAIIFTEYRDTLKAIRTAMEADPDMNGKFVELTGGLSSRQRQTRMADFEKPGIRFMLATDAASEGLNLQAHCRRLYHVELPWNPNRLEQRNGRIDRHGQTRAPIIRYFIYPDSPEDDVLDGLVRKIMEMQQDRVSTPDILGILSSARIEEALTDIDADEDNKGRVATLFKLIDEGREQFTRELSVFVSGNSGSYDKASADQIFSADPLIADDPAFEAFVLSRLQGSVKPARMADTYSLRTPPELKGPGVQDQYDCITMRRSVAVQSKDVEFVTRMHPLFLAMLDEALAKLTAAHSPSSPARRLAVRRHPVAKGKPLAVFTYAAHDAGNPKRLFAVAVDADGRLLDEGVAKLVIEDKKAPGEVQWADVSKTFEKRFKELQDAAGERVGEILQQQETAATENREKFAMILREDAEHYRADRLVEIEREEKLAGSAEEKGSQQLLFKSPISYRARRAAADTFHQKRLKEIQEYQKPRKPAESEPLGVLFVFPPEDGRGA